MQRWFALSFMPRIIAKDICLHNHSILFIFFFFFFFYKLSITNVVNLCIIFILQLQSVMVKSIKITKSSSFFSYKM